MNNLTILRKLGIKTKKQCSGQYMILDKYLYAPWTGKWCNRKNSGKKWSSSRDVWDFLKQVI